MSRRQEIIQELTDSNLFLEPILPFTTRHIYFPFKNSYGIYDNFGIQVADCKLVFFYKGQVTTFEKVVETHPELLFHLNWNRTF